MPCALLAAVLACADGSDVPRAAIEAVVPRDAVFSVPDEVPDALAGALTGRRAFNALLPRQSASTSWAST